MTSPEDSQDPEEASANEMPGWAAFAVMGSTIALCEASGVAAGLWVDHRWSTAPAGLLVGIVLGAVVAVVRVVQQVRRYL